MTTIILDIANLFSYLKRAQHIQYSAKYCKKVLSQENFLKITNWHFIKCKLDKMERSEVIETIGSITKMENLHSIDKGVLENSLVLRNIDPFPGYNTENEDQNDIPKSGSIFIILRYRYAPEKINRINKELINSKMVSCYPSFGEIITKEAIYPCIRLKGIENSKVIPLIQNYYKKNDLHLMAFRKFEGQTRIKIFKSFKIIEIYEGLYRDLNDGEKIYIRIPASLNWKRLEYITRKIKYSMNNRNFDTALGIIYRFCGPEDVLRIYDKDKSPERALLLKKLYIKEVKSDMLISAHNHYSD